MKIRYIEPFSRAVDRSVQICFRPFDLGKWFVLGFACWLAQLGRGGGGGNFSFPTPPLGAREAEGSSLPGNWKEWVESIEPEAIFGGAVFFLVLGCVALFLLVILPLLLWLSSRGEFIFLADVVHDKAEIKAPWREFREQGNSLFLWRLGFIVAVILGVALALAPLLLYIVSVGERGPSVPMVLALICPVVPLALGALYVNLFLRSFVVPIMYREQLKTSAAWRRFAPLLKARIGAFLLYGLWLLGLMIGVALAIMILALATCCIAVIPLIIPYIGTVLLLPLYVGLRALSLEFLAQFGDDFKIFPEPQPTVAATAAGPAVPPPPAPPAGTFEPDG